MQCKFNTTNNPTNVKQPYENQHYNAVKLTDLGEVLVYWGHTISSYSLHLYVIYDLRGIELLIHHSDESWVVRVKYLLNYRSIQQSAEDINQLPKERYSACVLRTPIWGIKVTSFGIITNMDYLSMAGYIWFEIFWSSKTLDCVFILYGYWI